MITFQPLDWLWLALFILLMVFFGFYFYRFGKRSQSDYFLADRGLPWWLPASSVYATHTATDTPIWVAGVVYKYGKVSISEKEDADGNLTFSYEYDILDPNSLPREHFGEDFFVLIGDILVDVIDKQVGNDTND